MAGSSPHQNVQYLGAGGMYDTNTTYGGGGVPIARSELDFLRMGVGREPSAEYPDGYLGTIRTRRDDRGRPNSASEKVLDSLKVRIGQKSYQRGVHRGERVDPQGYYYPDSLRADRGIRRQMRASYDGNAYVTSRYAPQFDMVPPPHLVNDGKANMRANEPGQIDEKRAAQLRRFKPAWS
jgi:hypothetical protein